MDSGATTRAPSDSSMQSWSDRSGQGDFSRMGGVLDEDNRETQAYEQWGPHWDGVFLRAAEERAIAESAKGRSEFQEKMRSASEYASFKSQSKGRPVVQPLPSLEKSEGDFQSYEDAELMASYIDTNKELVNIYRTRPQDLSSYLQDLAQSDRPLNMINIATAFFSAGKVKMNLPDPVVKGLVEKMKCVQDQIYDAKTLSNTLYGLNRFSGTQEVRNLLAVLVPMVERSTETFHAQHIGNMLYGMQHLGDSPEVRALLAALAPKFALCDEVLNAQAVSNALYGLQSVADSPEARTILVTLEPHVRRCNEALNAQHIGNVLYGLQNFSDSPELRHLLAAIIPLVSRSTAVLNAQSVILALRGIEKMGDTPYARRLMGVLTPKMQQCSKSMRPKDKAYVMYIMKRMRKSDEFYAFQSATWNDERVDVFNVTSWQP